MRPRYPTMAHPPLSRQATDQAERSGSTTVPGTVECRDVGPAKGQCGWGAQEDQPDWAELVGLLSDGGVQRDLYRPGQSHVEARLQVGQAQPPEQVEAGYPTGTSAGSTRPGRTGGCSATAAAVPTCLSSPGRRSSSTSWSRAERLRTIRCLSLTGPSGVARAASTGRRHHGAPASGTAWSLPDPRRTPVTRRPSAAKAPGVGSVAGRHQEGDLQAVHRLRRRWINGSVSFTPFVDDGLEPPG
ncbi:hypothetical protein FHS40_009175 [Streptomyces spectabilis]|uniref:Uncharacterized protein n=1 Tax=Streptomyces spectabilis TaxID=68270 RepID=A0A7W8B6G1_STRST|nr:hypothetical protein [Streptomyces spectabilis]